MLTGRQQEILEHAINIISEKGIQGLTMKNLSKRLGISEPAIYRHYDNKIEILLSLLDYFTNSTSGIFNDQSLSHLDAVERLKIIFNKHIEALEHTPALVAVIFSEEIFRNEAILSNKVKLIMERNAASIAAIIEEGKQKGELDISIDTQQLTTIFMGSLRLLVKRWQMCNFDFNLKQEGEALFDTLNQLVNYKS
ncbi:MAG: TetR/AcrR family transcriptional regulator [Bacteroidales bacterium]|jgi:AcrR family transcriptional regulator|nr:TetR/AcrR family transcriptional regulator [Bacteroidales bacterium]